MAFVGFFIFIVVLIILAIVCVGFVKRIFLNDKPDTPSKLAKIIGPILIIVSVMEWLAIAFFPAFLASFKLSDTDILDILIALSACFFSGICGFTLSMDYFQRYYKIPKYKQENQDKNEHESQIPNFVPRQFN